MRILKEILVGKNKENLQKMKKITFVNTVWGGKKIKLIKSKGLTGHCKPGEIGKVTWCQPTGSLISAYCISQSFCPYEMIKVWKVFDFFRRFWKFLKKGPKMSICTQTAHPKFPTSENPQKFEFLPWILGVPPGCQNTFWVIFVCFFRKPMT